jgi:hypothetical protein
MKTSRETGRCEWIAVRGAEEQEAALVGSSRPFGDRPAG